LEGLDPRNVRDVNNPLMAVWRGSGNGVARINEVTVRRARSTRMVGRLRAICNQPLRQLNFLLLAGREMVTSESASMLCG